MLKSKAKTAPAPATESGIIPQSVQRSVYESDTAQPRKSYLAPNDIFPDQYGNEKLPEALRGSTPPTQLPGDVKTCLLWWYWLQHAVKHPRLSREWRDFTASVRRRAHDLQQGLPVVEIDNGKLGAERAKAICTGEAQRAEESAALKAALESNFNNLPLVPMVKIAKPLVDFACTRQFVDLGNALRQSLAKYQIRFNELFNFHSQETRIAERKMALQGQVTPEQSKRIADEAALEVNPVFKDLQRNACAELSVMWHETVKPHETNLIRGAIAYVEQSKASWLEAERNFFEAAGVPVERTAASKQFDSLLADLQHRLEFLVKGPQVPVPGLGAAAHRVSMSVLSTVFGVELT